MPRVRVGLCQINTVVGDLDGNVDRILAALEQAEAAGCDVAVLPELAITGYPPEDLLLKPGFIRANRQALEKVAARTGRCAAAVGFVDQGRDLFNAAAICAHGEVMGVYHKRLLPNYAVFDEQRYFAAGDHPFGLYLIGGVRMGISICEDVWSPNGPIGPQAAGGAELILNLNASPYYAGRLLERERMLATRAEDAACGLVYVNQVGGQDELVFDGASLVFDADGRVLARAPQFVDAVAAVDVDVRPVFRKRLLDPRGRATAAALPVVEVTATPAASAVAIEVPDALPFSPEREVYEALVLGTRDYVRKNGFTDVVIGLSGGIDSSIVAVIAADALGAEHVHGVSMPSRFSSDHSRTDADALAERLGIDFRTIAIEPGHAALLEMLAPSFEGRPEDVTEENLQSRIRGMTLMALSNKFGWMVLTTGNKSEMAVGYSTLYGDTAGGFAVIKDVPKTLVYALCRERQRAGGPRADPRGGAHEAAVGRAEAGAGGRGQPAALRGARPDPRGVRRGRPHPRRARGGRLRSGDRPPGDPLGGPGRVQAAPDPAGRAGHAQGVRQGPPGADHERVPRLSRFDAVLFDFNGVVTSSPFTQMGALGAKAGIPPEMVLEFMMGPYHEDTDHPWHQVERGEMTMVEYAADLYARAAEAGLDLDFASLRNLMGRLDIHEVVVDRIRALRKEGYRTAVVTNNVREISTQWRELVPLDELFDVVVDSSEVGMRKPNPAIYLHTLEELGGIAPDRAVFLDDAAGNVEGARKAGLHAILVDDPAEAVAELDQLLSG